MQIHIVAHCVVVPPVTKFGTLLSWPAFLTSLFLKIFYSGFFGQKDKISSHLQVSAFNRCKFSKPDFCFFEGRDKLLQTKMLRWR